MENPILIQGAMNVETDYLIENLINKNKKVINGYEFYVGELSSVPVVISITKVGSINASVSTILAINEFKPKCVINQGIAGGYIESIHKGDIVLGEYAANMNSYKTNFYSKGEGIHPVEWKVTIWNGDSTNGQIKINANSELVNSVENFLRENSNKKVYKGTILSGDGWNNEIDRINWFIDKFDAKCEDMESYAVYKICSENNIPVLSARIISNNIVNGEEYDRNLAHEMQKEIYKFIVNSKKIKAEY